MLNKNYLVGVGFEKIGNAYQITKFHHLTFDHRDREGTASFDFKDCEFFLEKSTGITRLAELVKEIGENYGIK